MPELKEDEQGIVQGPRYYIYAITERWMTEWKVEDGIDGWKQMLPTVYNKNFWIDWRKHVFSINPDAYLTAEIINDADFIKPYLKGDQFDAIMNYNFLFDSTPFLVNEGDHALSLSQFHQQMQKLFKSYPDWAIFNSMNYMDRMIMIELHHISLIGKQ